MTDSAENDVRHEGSSFEPVPSDPAAPDTPTSGYPPQADPDQGGGLPAAEVPGEQVDPARRLTGGDQPTRGSGAAPDDTVTPGSTEPPD